MQPLPTELLSQACRLFMDIAYPQGFDSIPLARRCFYDIDPSQPIEDYLPGAPGVHELCQPLMDPEAGPCGYAYRLGSAHFPHLKLQVRIVIHLHPSPWVFMVDTHDAFSNDSRHPPDDHPDAGSWQRLQDANRILKERIEAQFDRHGLVTPNSLLRRDL